MTSLPLFHINAPTYSMLGSVGARASVALLPQLLRPAASSTPPAATAPPSSTRSARCSRSSCASPSAPTTPTTRCGSATPARRRREQRQLEIEQRFGLRIVCGYAMSESPLRADLAARHAPVRHARHRAPAPHARRRQRGARDARRPRRWRPARSASCSCATRSLMRGYWDMPEETAECSCRTAGCAPATWCEDNADGTYTFVGREQGGHPPARRERGAGRDRGGAESAPGRGRGGGRRRPVRRCRRRRSRRSWCRDGTPTWPRFASTPPSGSRASRCRATSRPSPSCRTRRPGGWPSTAAVRAHGAEIDFEEVAAA